MQQSDPENQKLLRNGDAPPKTGVIFWSIPFLLVAGLPSSFDSTLTSVLRWTMRTTTTLPPSNQNSSALKPQFVSLLATLLSLKKQQ
jgi:hypothetical protein